MVSPWRWNNNLGAMPEDISPRALVEVQYRNFKRETRSREEFVWDIRHLGNDVMQWRYVDQPPTWRCVENVEPVRKGPVAMPTDSAERKNIPLVTGCFDYFPDALCAVAALSKVGNDKHNPGQPLHWSRGKSNDHADTIARHLLQRGAYDTDGVLHSVKVAWRALALAQLDIEEINK